jgi:hypothetical protein
MKIAINRVKRAVPEGAKDLNLFDEFVGWRCPQCEQIDTELIGKCGCGSYTLREPWHEAMPNENAYEDNAPKFQAYLPGCIKIIRGDYKYYNFGCTGCIVCPHCKQVLHSIDIESEWRKDWENEEQDEVTYFLQYFHKQCVEDMRLEVHRKYQAEKESEQKRIEEEAQRQRYWQAEYDRRFKNRLCMHCGYPLGFTDKWSGKQSHARCLTQQV